MAWQCVFCLAFSALYISCLLTHYNSCRISNNADWKIRCGLLGCTKEYEKINSFIQHIRSQHQRLLFFTTEDIQGHPILMQGM